MKNGKGVNDSLIKRGRVSDVMRQVKDELHGIILRNRYYAAPCTGLKGSGGGERPAQNGGGERLPGDERERAGERAKCSEGERNERVLKY